MNRESSQSPDPHLQRLLQDWRVETPLPPGFNRAVWRRIAAESASERPTLLHALRNWLAAQFVRPAWSIGYALLLLSAGLLTGYWQAASQTARWDQQLASRYVQSVDPYFQVTADQR
jgi:hypothetical protein